MCCHYFPRSVLSKPFSYKLEKQSFGTDHPKKPVGYLEVAVIRGRSLRWSKDNLFAGAIAVGDITAMTMYLWEECLPKFICELRAELKY